MHRSQNIRARVTKSRNKKNFVEEFCGWKFFQILIWKTYLLYKTVMLTYRNYRGTLLSFRMSIVAPILFEILPQLKTALFRSRFAQMASTKKIKSGFSRCHQAALYFVFYILREWYLPPCKFVVERNHQKTDVRGNGIAECCGLHMEEWN